MRQDSGWACKAVPRRKPCLEHHAILRVRRWQPGDALLARRAGHQLALPANIACGLGQPIAQTGLPTRVVSNRTGDGHAMTLLTVHQHVRLRVALFHQMLAGGSLRFSRLLWMTVTMLPSGVTSVEMMSMNCMNRHRLTP